MIRIAICDDDIKYVSSTLNNYIIDSARKVHCKVEKKAYIDGNELIRDFSDGQLFDVVILDIEMPTINGKALASVLRELDNSFFLVFISSYPEHVFDTLKYNVKAFIPKDSEPAFIIAELSRVFSEYIKYSEKFELVEILDGGILSSIKIPLENILGFYYDRHTVYMKTALKDYILKEQTFSRITDHFTPLGFFECSRNYLVNIKRISAISDTSVTLTGNATFPVSRRNYRNLLSAFNRSIMNEVNG